MQASGIGKGSSSPVRQNRCGVYHLREKMGVGIVEKSTDNYPEKLCQRGRLGRRFWEKFLKGRELVLAVKSCLLNIVKCATILWKTQKFDLLTISQVEKMVKNVNDNTTTKGEHGNPEILPQTKSIFKCKSELAGEENLHLIPVCPHLWDKRIEDKTKRVN